MWKNFSLRPRLIAFSFHFVFSFLIFLLLTYFLLFVWYPGFLFDINGGWEGLRIIIFVDLVLGPLLTFIIFDKNKSRDELKRDLSIIAIIQFICLFAGVYIVYKERPQAIVYSMGQFFVVSNNEIKSLEEKSFSVDGEVYKLSAPNYSKYSREAVGGGASVPWLAIDFHSDEVGIDVFHDLRKKNIFTFLYSKGYTSFNTLSKERFLSFAYSETEVKNMGWEEFDTLKEWRSEHTKPLNDYLFYELRTRFKTLYIVFKRSDYSYVDIIDVYGNYRPGKG